MKKLLTIIFTCLVLLSQGQDTANLWILAGGDNAVGHGDENSHFYPARPQDVLANSKIWTGVTFETLRGSTIFNGGVVGNNDGNGGGGVLGPEFALMHWLSSEYTTKNNYLVKHALANSTMAAWVSTGLDALKAKVVAAKTNLEGQGKVVVIKGITWAQGEPDAINGRTTSQYLVDLNSVRTHLSTYTNSASFYWAVYQLTTGTGGNGAGLASVREAQKQFVDADAGRRVLVNCDTRNPLGIASATYLDGFGYQYLGYKAARYTSNRNNPRTDPTARRGPFLIGGTPEQRTMALDALDLILFPLNELVLSTNSKIIWEPIIHLGVYGQYVNEVLTIETSLNWETARHTIPHEIAHAVDESLPLTTSMHEAIATLVGAPGREWSTGNYDERLTEGFPDMFILAYTNENLNTNSNIWTISPEQAPALRAIIGVPKTDAIIDTIIPPVEIPITPIFVKARLKIAPPAVEVPDNTGTYILPASTISNGAYAANSLSPDFYNAPGVRTGNSFVGNPVEFDVDTTFLVQSKYKSRDAEITTYFENGWLFAREGSNKAIYLFYDKLNGGVVATGIVNDMAVLKTTVNYSTAISNGAISELQRKTSVTVSLSDSLTFKVEGFAITVTKAGLPIIDTRQYIFMQVGTIAFKSLRWDRQPGFTGFTAKHLSRAFMYGNYVAGEIDLRDWGWKKAHTTGTFPSAGSSSLTVANPGLYKVGDKIIVAAGGESDGAWTAGQRKSKGVGGRYPENEFANEAALKANTSFPNGTFAYANDTRKVYERDPDGWWQKEKFVPIAGGQLSDENYYSSYVIPKAYRGTVTEINGNVLTMDEPCYVATTNANVWFDNTITLNSLTAYGGFGVHTIILPADTVVMSESWKFFNTAGWTFKGRGVDSSLLFSPLGTPEVRLGIHTSCKKMTFEHFSMNANSNLNTFTYRWWGTAYDGGGSDVSNFISNGGGFVLGDSSQARYVNAKDFHTGIIGIGGMDSKVSYCDWSSTTGAARYSAWVAATTNVRDTFDHMTWHCPKMMAVFETFGGFNNVFSNISGTNITFSSNGGNTMQIRNIYDTITALSNPLWQAASNPLINYNNNNGSGSGYSGIIENFFFHFEGYIDTFKKLNTVIVVQPSLPDVIVRNGSVTVDASIRNLPTTNLSAISMQGQNGTVDNVSVIGRCDGDISNGNFNESAYNISIRNGVVRNCTVNSLMVFISGESSLTVPPWYYIATEENNTVLHNKMFRNF